MQRRVVPWLTVKADETWASNTLRPKPWCFKNKEAWPYFERLFIPSLSSLLLWYLSCLVNHKQDIEHAITFPTRGYTFDSDMCLLISFKITGDGENADFENGAALKIHFCDVMIYFPWRQGLKKKNVALNKRQNITLLLYGSAQSSAMIWRMPNVFHLLNILSATFFHGKTPRPWFVHGHLSRSVLYIYARWMEEEKQNRILSREKVLLGIYWH